MKPRRSFESVVKELIAGLETGEIVLSRPPSKPAVAASDVMRSNQIFPPGTQIDSVAPTNEPIVAMCRQLSRIAKIAVEETELEKTVAQTHDRMWLVVGGSDKAFEVLWKILLTSKLGSSGRVGFENPYKEYDTRIIVTGFRPIHRDWLNKLDSFGLADNVRVVERSLHGWVVFADSHLYADMPNVWQRTEKSNIGGYPGLYSMDTVRGTVDYHSLFTVEKRAHPDEFHNIERSFLDLWEVAVEK